MPSDGVANGRAWQRLPDDERAEWVETTTLNLRRLYLLDMQIRLKAAPVDPWSVFAPEVNEWASVFGVSRNKSSERLNSLFADGKAAKESAKRWKVRLSALNPSEQDKLNTLTHKYNRRDRKAS